MADAATTLTTTSTVTDAAHAAAPQTMVTAQQVSTMVVDLFGYHINLMALVMGLIILGTLTFAYRIQKSNKLDFADMITKDGKSVSLTKVLQLVGGITSTWIMIKLTLTGGLTETLLGLYLTYVGAIEGYSKFVAAKYGYKEGSVKDQAADPAPDTTDPSLKPPKG